MLRAFAVLSATILLAACSSGAVSQIETKPSAGGRVPPTAAASADLTTVLGAPLTAPSTVARFYDAVAHHDATTAESLLSPTALDFESHVVAPLWGSNTISLDSFRVESVRPDPNDKQLAQPGFTDMAQVTVSFDVVYRDVGLAGDQGGPSINFDYVGRQGAGGEWRILAIGGGP